MNSDGNRRLTPGDVVAGRFEVEHHVRSGGMGAVYRGRDRASDHPVAVKLLGQGGAYARERFEREATLLSKFTHPGVVRYLAHGILADETPFLVMDWIDGETLAERLSRKRLVTEEALVLVGRVATALAPVHEQGLVHRDLTPRNILLPGGALTDAVIIDFGLVRPTRQTHGLTRTGVLVGTIEYMAPEQARALRNVDQRADVFALGCVLYECLTGRSPFAGPNMMAIRAKILFDPPPSLGAAMPAEIVQLAARMLARDPARRPADAAAVAAEIAALRGARARPAAPARPDPATRPRLVVMAAMPADRPSAVEALADPVRRLAEAHGVPVELLADGSIAAQVSGDATLPELASRAAELALALRALLPEAAIAISSVAIDAAAELIAAANIERVFAGLMPSAVVPEAIRIDAELERLLAGRYDVGPGLLLNCGASSARRSR